MSINLILRVLSLAGKVMKAEELKMMVMMLITFIREKVAGTASTVDDMIVLPLMEAAEKMVEMGNTNLALEYLIVAIGEFTGDLIKELADKILDLIENKIEDTKNKFDDIMLLPICKVIRAVADIPDND